MEKLEIKVKAIGGLSDDELFAFCQENEHLRIERDRHGNILVMSPTGGITGNKNFNLSGVFYEWNRKKKKGYLFDSNTGFTLPNGAMRSPDLSFILKENWERLPEEDQEKFAHVCPDFVIELRSKNDSLSGLHEKMQEYMDNGTRLGWLIDPYDKKVHIYDQKVPVSIHDDFSKSLKGKYFMDDFEIDLNNVLA